MKYLLNNRKHATYWNSTRDTALCVEALADYLKASGEDKPDMTVEVWLDGKKQKEVKITAAEPVHLRQQVRADGDAVTDGEHKIELKKHGTRPALLQRLPDQLHARRSDHQGRPGDQGEPQVSTS